MKEHFNKEMDDYLHKRKGGRKEGIRIRFSKDKPDQPSFLARLFSKKKSNVVMTTEEGRKVDDMEEELMETDKEMHELQDEERRLERKRDSILVRLFNFFNSKKEELPDEVDLSGMDLPDRKGLDPETIEILKIAGRWINRLPPEEKMAFKRSPDYAVYKDFLDRNGLTKK